MLQLKHGTFDPELIKTDEEVIIEYHRLQEKYNRLISNFAF